MTSRRIAAAIAACLVPVLTAGCAVTIEGLPVPGDKVVTTEVDTDILKGSDGGPVDQIAAAAITDVQAYWRERFEPAFGEQWRDVTAFYSVDTSDDNGRPPPCAEKASDVEGNAFYCGAQDVIAFDRTALFPVLVDRYGEAGIVVVLAHEIGHAVHNRLGIDVARQRAEPRLYPTIVLESMADCYAGAFMKWVTDGDAQHLDIDAEQLDSALGALVSFRDPVGTGAADRGAHGNAFDRVSSFQDGYERGPELCAEITAQNRPFTLQEFTSVADEQRGGNLDLPDLVENVTADLDTVFGDLTREQGGDWQAPRLTDDPGCSGDQGPIAYCPDDRAIALDAGRELAELHEIGDFATGTQIASRYGLAVLAALGKDVDGDTAGRAAVCLAGVYTNVVLTQTGRDFVLSPGDLDEAVLLLLQYDFPARDGTGDAAPGTGFDRVSVFRTGTLDGLDGCDLG